MITAHLIGDTIFSNSEEAFSLYEKSSLGEKRKNRIEYSFVESLFLIDEGKMNVLQNSKPLSEESLLRKIKKKDKKIETKFSVFKDLRKKGYIVKTAFKYGAEFRVYEKGIKPGDRHSKWILYTAREQDSLNWHDFAAKNRVAHSTQKKLLIAIVDEESDVTYYEISWLKT